jgi:hypothetical protein
MGAAVHLTRKKGIYRVRVLPPDAAPAHPVVAETHIGHLSAQTAAHTACKVLGLPLVDESHSKGGDNGTQ